MSKAIDQQLKTSGTRFRLYPQSPSLADYVEPEVVWVSSAAGTLLPGPEDERMRVVDAIGKPPYSDDLQPPWRGGCNPAAAPDAAGHFDHHEVGTRAFGAAHMFGGVRRVLDIWEDYLGRPINLRSIETDPTQKLELIPEAELEKNAQTGMGFIEMGYVKGANQERRSLGLNIDVLAHEVGHRIVFDLVGLPSDSTLTSEFRGFAESAADLVALITALHFQSVIDNVLEASSGNLYVMNELNRFAELSDNDQIRIASNNKRMEDVVDVATPALELTQPVLHELGEPLTGAFFDILVEFFHEKVADRGAIPRELADHVWRGPKLMKNYDEVQDAFDEAYDDHPEVFKEALIDARDELGPRLARTWQKLSPHLLTYRNVAAAFVAVDARLDGRRFQRSVADCFKWRQIGPPRPLVHAPGGATTSSWLAPRGSVCDRSPANFRKSRKERRQASSPA